MARRNLGRDCDIKTLLYTQEGVEEALKIWKEGEKRHKEQTRGRGERGKGRGVGAGRFRKMMEKGGQGEGRGCLECFRYDFERWDGSQLLYVFCQKGGGRAGEKFSQRHSHKAACV